MKQGFRPRLLLGSVLGLYFAWLLTFPFFGPILGSLAGASGIDPSPIFSAFIIGHALGLLTFGFIGLRVRLTRVWFVVAALAVATVTLVFVRIPPAYWLWVMRVLGVASAIPVMTWVGGFADQVPYEYRGRTISVAQVMANVALILVGLSLRRWPPTDLLWVAAAVLALSAIGAWATISHSSSASSPPRFREPAPSPDHPAPLSPWQVGLLILFFSIAAGLVNQIVYPAQFGDASLPVGAGLMAYVLVNAAGGYFCDRFGRRRLAVASVVMLGMSLLIGSTLRDTLGLRAAEFLVQASYAPIDLFLWTSLADAAPPGKATGYYGIGLGLNVFGIFLGSSAVARLTALFPGSDGVLIAAASLFLAVPVVTLSPIRPSTLKAAISTFSEDASLLASFGLSLREREIALLLLDGLSNDDLVSRLTISPNTLKTHLRHIYQKTGTANRRELILKVTRKHASPDDGKKQAG